MGPNPFLTHLLDPADDAGEEPSDLAARVEAIGRALLKLYALPNPVNIIARVRGEMVAHHAEANAEKAILDGARTKTDELAQKAQEEQADLDKKRINVDDGCALAQKGVTDARKAEEQLKGEAEAARTAVRQQNSAMRGWSVAHKAVVDKNNRTADGLLADDGSRPQDPTEVTTEQRASIREARHAIYQTLRWLTKVERDGRLVNQGGLRAFRRIKQWRAPRGGSFSADSSRLHPRPATRFSSKPSSGNSGGR
jgi:hypothetical protein